ncbi:hypothetical protein G7Y79_00034g069130 [Physcia stellaris]|nr:hypothetical protein G7Y79_00034g069130 [Physcia stellaris]
MKSTILGAIGVLLSAYPANATPLQSLEPRAATPLAGYNYSGCYTEATNQRALTGSQYFDDTLTVEKCAAACVAFARFGVEYGRECYCGDALNAGSVQAPWVIAASLVQATRMKPAALAIVSTCIGNPARTLAATSTENNGMTVEICSATCQAYAYFGVEYFRECYCGNTIAPGGVPAPAAECDSPCSGNSAEKCGGNSRLNLYQYNK